MSDKKARLSIDGIEETIELPVYEGTTGPDVIDVRSLVSRGVFTYDPGFVSTASCDSEITYIDGDHGILRVVFAVINTIAKAVLAVETIVSGIAKRAIAV